jgi:hypothetical protein
LSSCSTAAMPSSRWHETGERQSELFRLDGMGLPYFHFNAAACLSY